MLFDPVLNYTINSEEIKMIQRDLFSQPLICAHCYRPIKGKLFQSGNNFYDEYCWQFRFVIDPLFIERASRKRIKSFDEEGNEI